MPIRLGKITDQVSPYISLHESDLGSSSMSRVASSMPLAVGKNESESQCQMRFAGKRERAFIGFVKNEDISSVCSLFVIIAVIIAVAK